MALTEQQLEEVLKYSAFQNYDFLQKTALRKKLTTGALEYLQVAVLFSDEAAGGMIHNLVADSQESDEAARQLGKIIANMHESINPDYGYPPTPIIQNMLGRLGSIPFDELASDAKETIFDDVKWLARQHVAICNARIIEPSQADFHSFFSIGRIQNSAHSTVESLAPSAPQSGSDTQEFTEIAQLAQLQAEFAANLDMGNTPSVPSNIIYRIFVAMDENPTLLNWQLIHFLEQILENAPGTYGSYIVDGLKTEYLDNTPIQQHISDALNLGDGLFTADDLIDISTECLYEITAPNALQALREGRTTIDLLTQMDKTELHNANVTNEYPTPLQPNL